MIIEHIFTKTDWVWGVGVVLALSSERRESPISLTGRATAGASAMAAAARVNAAENLI